MQFAHDLGPQGPGLPPQDGKPGRYWFSLEIESHHFGTEGKQELYRERLWEVSERIVEPFADREWVF